MYGAVGREALCVRTSLGRYSSGVVGEVPQITGNWQSAAWQCQS
jgi:hypothetical protein